MNRSFLFLSFLGAFGLYFLGTIYAGLRYYNFLHLTLGFNYKILYWILLLPLCASPIFKIFVTGYVDLRSKYYRALTWVASIVVAFFTTSLLCFVISDIAIYFLKLNTSESIRVTQALIVGGISSIVSIYGITNALTIKTKAYDVKIDKPAKIDNLKILFASDFHLGVSFTKKQVDNFVKKVNDINPDIFCIGGDLLDHDSHDDLVAYCIDAFKNIKTKYGTYYVPGNHEYYRGDVKTIFNTMSDSGINVLVDESILLDSDIYIIGRDDKQVINRKSIRDLVKKIDPSKPMIVLNHEPHGFLSSAHNGVDLELFGHTHAGQIFPFNLLIRLGGNDKTYGFKKMDSYHAIISSGIGTWGYIFRTCAHCELLVIDVSFNKK